MYITWFLYKSDDIFCNVSPWILHKMTDLCYKVCHFVKIAIN